MQYVKILLISLAGFFIAACEEKVKCLVRIVLMPGRE